MHWRILTYESFWLGVLAGIVISAAYYYVRDHQRIVQREQDERRAKLQTEWTKQQTELNKAANEREQSGRLERKKHILERWVLAAKSDEAVKDELFKQYQTSPYDFLSMRLYWPPTERDLLRLRGERDEYYEEGEDQHVVSWGEHRNNLEELKKVGVRLQVKGRLDG